MWRTALFLALLLGACSTSATILRKLQHNMTQQQVTQIMGEPESVPYSGMSEDRQRFEVWEYYLSDRYIDSYVLVFVNGRLKRWGSAASFTPPADVTIRVE